MIQIYDIGNENYDRNGNAVLTPTAGRVTMQAGGACDISLTLPMDPEGKWRHVVPGAVVKAPVPREVIENSFSGYAADIYKTVGAADLREDKVAPTPISYPQWNAMDMTYHVGSRVSCYGWPHQNYECTYFDNSSPITQVPPYNSAWWKPIADYTPGAAVVVSLPAGSELYWIENAGSGWYKMSTYYGLEGYIQTSAVVFDRHVSETENQPRIITEQLFRLREPSINNETRTVTVTGQHVSYDLAGILCKNITITQASPAMAMGRVVENMMMDYRGTIATNLTSEENGTYTGKTNGKNGMFMLLDPDAGIVHAFNAKFTRDNWDVFVMKKSSALSGFRISYAKNMRGVTWKKSSAGLVTRVVPVAKNTDGEDLYLPEKWVDSAHIAEYPVILMELLRISAQVGRDDGTGTDTVWTESALFDYMREKAGERFSVDHVDEVVDDLTVQFEQLGDTAEYEWVRPLESVLLYDNIVCQDRDIGLEKVLTVTELEWDPIRRKVTGIKLSNITGAAGRTVTGFSVQNNSITPAKLTEEVTQEIVGQVQALIPDYTDPQAGSRPNTRTQDGVVTKGQGQGNKIWKTDNDGNPAWRDESSFELPLAADGVRGGIQIGFTAYGKNYPVALDGEKAYVHVPWTADGGNAATVNGHTVETNVPAGAVFTDHYAWSDITSKPATATRWPTWDEVTGKPNRAGSNSDGGNAYGAYGIVRSTWPTSLDDFTSDGKIIYTYQGGLNEMPGKPSGVDAYGIVALKDAEEWQAQLLFSSNAASGVYWRTGTSLSGGWKQLIDSSNYTDYTVTKTGGGASGTWGISVTGSAGSVPWRGVGNPPATATRWPTWNEVTQKPNRAGSATDGGTANSAVYSTSLETPAHSEDDCVPANGRFQAFRCTASTTGWGDGYIWAQRWSDGNYVTQIFTEVDAAYVMFYRYRDSANNWGAWKRIPMGDGIGASGTWGINVTGSAGSVPWSGVGNPPATATRWPTWDEVTGKPNRAGSATDGGNAYGAYGLVRFETAPTSLDNFTSNGDVRYFYQGGGNSMPGKPSGVSAYGVMTLKDADGWNAQLLFSSNLATGMYWRTGSTLSGGWRLALDSSNYTDYTVTKTGSGASGTWGISITGNADTVDSFHGEDLLTEVDSFKRRLQVRTGSGTLANNTDTYIAFSSPFSTLCAAVVPVSTSGFNAPNALSIVSNNRNGVTLKQNNTLGVSMNVIVVAFGY